jgi:hypothetical protein
MNLIPYLDNINNLNTLGQRLNFNTDHWRNFDYNNSIVTNDMAFISENYQNGISRQEIINYLKCNGFDDSDLRLQKLFKLLKHNDYEYKTNINLDELN